jgi:hypothetical protein
MQKLFTMEPDGQLVVCDVDGKLGSHGQTRIKTGRVASISSQVCARSLEGGLCHRVGERATATIECMHTMIFVETDLWGKKKVTTVPLGAVMLDGLKVNVLWKATSTYIEMMSVGKREKRATYIDVTWRIGGGTGYGRGGGGSGGGGGGRRGGAVLS